MHNDALLKIFVFTMLWQKITSGPKITQGVKLDTAFSVKHNAKGITNCIRNIPKKPSTQSYREVLSFRYVVTENLDSKVIIDFFRKSYL